MKDYSMKRALCQLVESYCIKTWPVPLNTHACGLAAELQKHLPRICWSLYWGTTCIVLY